MIPHTPFNDLPLPQQAGILCNEEQFCLFAGARTVGEGVELCPGAAAEFVRAWCGISSRAELTGNPEAARKFNILRTEFDAWRGRIAGPDPP